MVVQAEEEDVPLPTSGLGAHTRNSLKWSKRSEGTAATAVSSLTLPSTSEELVDRATDGEEEEEEESHNNSNSNVSFGNVHVHKHRMTLGDNPEARGIPVQVRWEEEESEEFSDPEAFEQQAGSNHDLKKLSKTKRQEIASQNHSRQSLALVEEEIKQIQLSRQASGQENVRKAELKEEKEKRRQKSIVGRIRSKVGKRK